LPDVEAFIDSQNPAGAGSELISVTPPASRLHVASHGPRLSAK